MNSGEMTRRVLACAQAIRESEAEYRRCIEAAADCERRYKRREAIALLEVTSYKNADDRRAQAELLPFADGNTLGDLRYAAHLAQGLMDAAKLAVRNRGQELSAIQSEAALAKAEAGFLSTAPMEAVGP
jgi:hypothetical protein